MYRAELRQTLELRLDALRWNEAASKGLSEVITYQQVGVREGGGVTDVGETLRYNVIASPTASAQNFYRANKEPFV